MKKILCALALVVSVGSVSAATLGNAFEIERADAFEIGVTTLEFAKEQLGPPVSVSTDADGNQTIWWKYVNVNFFGKDVRRLSVVFDKDGKMLRIAHREAFK